MTGTFQSRADGAATLSLTRSKPVSLCLQKVSPVAVFRPRNIRVFQHHCFGFYMASKFSALSQLISTRSNASGSSSGGVWPLRSNR